MPFKSARRRGRRAFETKYLDKVVRLTGGHVGRIGTDMFVVYQLAGPHKNFPLDVVNCLLQPAAKDGVASLNKDQKITVTGTLEKGDQMRTADLAPILDNCTYQ